VLFASVTDIAVWLGAVATALAFLVPVVIAAKHRSDANEVRQRKMLDAVETITGIPAKGGRPAVPALPLTVSNLSDQVSNLQAGQVVVAQQIVDVSDMVEAQIKGVAEQVATISREVVQPNGMLHDAIADISSTVKGIDARLTEHLEVDTLRFEEVNDRLNDHLTETTNQGKKEP
jgi:hypothetical protein